MWIIHTCHITLTMMCLFPVTCPLPAAPLIPPSPPQLFLRLEAPPCPGGLPTAPVHVGSVRGDNHRHEEEELPLW